MSRWSELPAELHPHVRQLVVRLRRLKDRGELSTRQLAAATGYSTRSWQRYLNGWSLPPRGAVEAIARVGGDDPDRLLVLHEMAAERWAEGSRVSTDAWDITMEMPESASGERQRTYTRVPQTVLAVGAVALVVSLSAVLMLALQLTKAREAAQDTQERTVAAAGPEAETGAHPGAALPTLHTCRLEKTGGRWYAGYSRTRKAVVTYGQMGPEVIEVQCLLQRAGFSSGAVDGIYGPMTLRAVKGFQTESDLAADGVIGPMSWKALRAAPAKK
ncbi:MAG TPA: peptidoglycan-binding protein [Streptomyces sp.]|nr:peptidoglycan-binding protein [Streptomyces sp.]